MLNYVDITGIVILFLILIGMSLSYNSNSADGLSGLASCLTTVAVSFPSTMANGFSLQLPWLWWGGFNYSHCHGGTLTTLPQVLPHNRGQSCSFPSQLHTNQGRETISHPFPSWPWIPQIVEGSSLTDRNNQPPGFSLL